MPETKLPPFPTPLAPFTPPGVPESETVPTPAYEPPSPENAMATLTGLMLIAQGRPELFEGATQTVERRRAAAVQEANDQFQRKLQTVEHTERQQERTRTAAMQKREGAIQERQLSEAAYTRDLDAYYKALDAAREEVRLTMERKRQAQLDTEHETNVLMALDKMRQDAQETVMLRHSVKGGAATRPRLSDLQKNLSPMEYGEYLKIQTTQGPEAADAYAAQRLGGKAAALQDVFGGAAGGLTTTKLIKETMEMLRANPLYQRLATEAKIPVEDLFRPEYMPTFMQDLPPETQALALDFSSKFLPYMKKGMAPIEARASIGTSLKALSLSDGGAEYAERVTDAITTYWEMRYDIPRSMGVGIINDLINDYAEDDEIDMVIKPTEQEQPPVEEQKKEIFGPRKIPEGEFKGLPRKFYRTVKESEEYYRNHPKAAKRAREK